MCGVINVTNDFLQHSKSCYVVKYCNSIKVATDMKLRKYGGDFSASKNIEKITERFTSQFSTSKTSLEIHPLSLSTINLHFRKCNTYVSICTQLKNSKLYLLLMIPKSFFISLYHLYIRSHCNFCIFPFTFFPRLFAFRT